MAETNYKTFSNLQPDVLRMNFFQRITGMILNPYATCMDLIEKPRILFAILAMLLSTPILYLSRYSLFESFANGILDNSIAQGGANIPVEYMDMTKTYFPIYLLVLYPIISILLWLSVSVALFLLVKLLKGEGKFKQFLSITGYSYIIIVFYHMLTGIVSFVSGSIQFDASLANISNLLIPQIKGSHLYGVLRGIDLFNIWQYVVICIGISALTKLSKVKVYTVVFLIFLITVVIGSNNFRLL